MKKILLLIFMLAPAGFLHAQVDASGRGSEHVLLPNSQTKKSRSTPVLPAPGWSWGAGYELALPQHSFHQGMRPVHSLALQGGLLLNGRLMLGAETSLGAYAMRSYNVAYQAGNNKIDANVNYESIVFQGGLQGQYQIGPLRRITPFLSLRAGYTRFFSTFRVEENSLASCRVLDARTLQSDGTWYYGYGAGLRIFTGGDRGRGDFISLSAQHTQGGFVDYVNVSKLQHHDGPVPTGDGKALQATFVNAGNREVHRHTLAEVYRNRLNLLQIRVGYQTFIRW
ncbi:hypothetical protein [Flaviaesturariibacter amylovorans]|uniref:Outer membrane protein beta-barrel domain-containing protein n=1 Tax=Flaviaesturariibacter amylovorans TaxID=1084520 RepID=A0ABP8G8G5_9BACT